MSDLAIVSGDRRLSYDEFGGRIACVSEELKRRGVYKGARVAIILDNKPEYVALMLSLFNIGAVAVPLNTRYPQSQILDILKKINCEIIISDNPRDDRYPDEFIKIHYQIICRSIDKSVVSDLHKYFESVPKDQDATVILTSGSSGEPKAALHDFGAHYYNAIGSNENIKIAPGDTWLLSLPLFHVGGLGIVFRTLLAGAAIAIPAEGEDLLAAIENYNANHLSLVATQFYRLLKSERGLKVMQKAKAVLLGGSAIPDSLLVKAFDNNINVMTSYGSTEMASQIATTEPGHIEKEFSSSGKILSYRLVKISESGEILVKGQTLFKGYIENNKLIRSFDNEGYFRTGDIGRIDNNGRLCVKGRWDNMFISGGENIFPEEIEKALYHIDGINKSVVIPIESAEFGKRPLAFVEFDKGNEYSYDEIKELLSERIARFKIPDKIIPFPASYEEKGIKPDRRSLAEYAEKNL